MSMIRRACALASLLPLIAHAAPGGAGTTVRGEDPRLGSEVGAEEARRLPGTAGDPLRAAEDLPGVGRPPPGSAQLALWGAGPRDTRTLIEGIEVPALYHIGGLRGVIHPGLVERLELLPAAFGAAFGRAIGGLLQVALRPPVPADGHRLRVEISADLLDGSALISVAPTPRLQVFLAGRYGWLDQLLPRVLPEKTAMLYPVPRWADWQAGAVFTPRPGEAVDVLYLGSDDDLRRAAPSADPGAARQEAEALSVHRLALRYRGRAGDGGMVRVLPYAGLDQRRRSLSVGEAGAAQASLTWSYGLRASYRRPIKHRGLAMALTAGLDLRGERASLSRTGSLTIPGREGDPRIFGRPPGDDASADEWTAHVAEIAPYLSAEARLGPLLILPGLRLGAQLIEASRRTPRAGATPAVGLRRIAWALEPRLLLRLRPSQDVTLSAAFGLHHQPPDPEDLSAVFGNPELGPARAVHAAGMGAVRVAGLVEIEGAAYLRWFDQLPVRSAQGTPELARALVQKGQGRAYGGQLQVRLQGFRGLSGWIAYTLGRSERRDGRGGRARLFDQDQTHLLTVVAAFAWRRWGASLRLRYGTGFPRTGVVDAFYDARDDAYQPVLGPPLGERLPDFVQLDLRAERSVAVGKGVVDIYIEVLNATARENAEEFLYSEDYRQRGVLPGLPILALAGARAVF